MKPSQFVRYGVLLTAIVSMGRLTRAQQEMEGPAMAVGSGRMVRGTVTAVGPNKLTLKTEAGEIYQVSISPNTQVRKGRDIMKFSEVRAGDGVGAMGEMEPATKTVHALVLAVMDAEQIKKAKEALGKSWIAGKVTSIEELRLTVLRSDGVVQVIQVDEDTSFKRGGRGMQMMFSGNGGAPAGNLGTNSGANGGESITLADVKVGDMIAGPGAIKSGAFVPTQLAVMDPAAARRRRQDGQPTEPK